MAYVTVPARLVIDLGPYTLEDENDLQALTQAADVALTEAIHGSASDNLANGPSGGGPRFDVADIWVELVGPSRLNAGDVPKGNS